MSVGITSTRPEGEMWESMQAFDMKEISVSSRSGELWGVQFSGRVWRSPFYCEVVGEQRDVDFYTYVM